MIKILKNGLEIVKKTNGIEDFIKKFAYDYSIVDDSHLGLYKLSLQ